MNKELKKLLIIVSISIFVCVVLVACKSKKVKDNEYTTSKEFVYSHKEYNVAEELKFELYGVGKNIIRVDISKPEIEKIYEEREQLDYDRTAGNPIDKNYRYEMEIYLKKGDEIKLTIKANKFGWTFTSENKIDDGMYLNGKGGKYDNLWIYKKRIMEMQLIYPGVVEYVKECDTYEVYFVDKEEDVEEALHNKDNIINSPFPMGGTAVREKMLFELECENEDIAYVKIHSKNFNSRWYDEILITMGEGEDKYILFQKIENFDEIETVDALYYDADYNDEEDYYKHIHEPDYKIEIGEISYSEDGEKEFIPLKTESGKIYNTPTLAVASCYYSFLIKREGIKAFFDDCNIYRGYVGDDFEELVYVVTK